MFLLLVFVMLLVVLGVLFFVGTLFAQSSIFTEPTEGLAWRAPTAAGIMAVFFTFWCVLAVIVRSDGKIPYTTIFTFRVRSDMLPKATPEIWAYRGDGQVLHYGIRAMSNSASTKTFYQNLADPSKTFTNTGVIAVEIMTPSGEKSKFKLNEGGDNAGEYFINDEGYRLEDDRDISGNPTRMSWGLLIGNVLLNTLHFVLWFVCLWLILRFSVGSSVLFAAILWGLTTIALLPMLLEQAASYH